MAGNNVQVSLSFTADTQRARQEIQNLQNSLNQLGKAAPQSLMSGQSLTSITQAQQAVGKLQVALQSAINVDTGKLNLTKFNTSLEQSGMSLKQYRAQLENLGPAGEQAFLNLTKSIMSADTQLKHTNKLVNSLWHAFKQTAKFQFTASIYRGLTSGLSSAFQYAEDLNRSLNDIRIVTGSSVEDMARFADQANKAAKALSTTTTEYTNASLIYFQQGLSEDQVQKRADITVKMANASGQSAEVVSDQLTAVWNNFYDGSKSLEYYADVMTKLGAETASSADEIAGGLEKFAAIGDTIGLSYEYAASALATITAETRQSEEVVGTALKTIFARIQGLKLGETLDDGTELNKYSEALQSVGISIFEQNGELKNMDNILNEMGAKWDSLSKAQQTALAQTVAGTRQYTQLVALMDKWDVMQQNLETSYGASGALQEQADIYAESWEGAQQRVKAAAERIYQSLINDEFFIDLNNILADSLGLIEKFIDSIGGAVGVFGILGTALTKVFSTQLTNSISSLTQSIWSMSKGGQAAAEAMRSEAMAQAQIMLDRSKSTGGDVGVESEVTSKIYEKRLQAYKQLQQDAKTMIEEEIKFRQIMLDTNEAYEQRTIEAAKQVDIARKNSDAFQTQLNIDVKNVKGKNKGKVTSITNADEIAKIKDELQQTGQITANTEKAFIKYYKSIYGNSKKAVKTAQNHINALKEEYKAVSNLETAEKNMNKTRAESEQLNKSFAQTTTRFQKFGQQATTTLQGVSQLTMGLSSLSQIFSTMANEDMSGWEKFSSVIMSLGFGLPSIVAGFQSLNSILGITTIVKEAIAIATAKQAFNEESLVVSMTAEQIAQKTGLALDQAEIVLNQLKAKSLMEQIVSEGRLTTAVTSKYLAKKLGITTDQVDLILSKMKTGASFKEAAAEAGVTLAIQGHTLATKLATIANTGFLASFPPLIAIIAVFAAAILAVVGVVKIFQALLNQKTSAEEELKNLKEATIGLTETSKQLNEELAKTKTAINDIYSSYDKIDNLKKGTLEWAQAVADVNNKVLTLKDTYDNLTVSLDEDGVYRISKADTDRLIAEQENAAVLVSFAARDTDFQKRKLELETIRDKEDYDTQAIINAISNTRGTISGKSYDLIGLLPGNYDKDREGLQDYFNDFITESYQNQGEAIFEKNDSGVPKWFVDFANKFELNEDYAAQSYQKIQTSKMPDKAGIQATVFSNEQIRDLTNENAEWELEKQRAYQASANQVIKMTGFEDYEETEEEGEKYEQYYEEASEKVAKGEVGPNEIFSEDIIKKYFAPTGYEKIEYDDEGNATITKKDGSTEEVSRTEAEQIYKTEEAAKKIEFNEVLPQIQNAFDQVGKQIKVSAEQMYTEGSLSTQQISKIGNNIDMLSDFERASLDTMDEAKEFLNILSGGGSIEDIEEFAKKIGVADEDIDKFVETLQKGSLSMSNFTGATDAFNALMAGEEYDEKALMQVEERFTLLGEYAEIFGRDSSRYIEKFNEALQTIEFEDINNEFSNFKEIIQDTESEVSDLRTNLESYYADMGDHLTEHDEIRLEAELPEKELEIFSEKFEELTEQSHLITVAIEADIESDLAYIKNAIEDIEDASSKIGEGFKVSADDIEAVAAAFPGILENYTITADGMIQLDSQVAQSAIGAAQAEVDANTQKVIAKLQIERDYNQAMGEMYIRLADGFKNLAESQINIDQLKTQALSLEATAYTDLTGIEQTRQNEISKLGSDKELEIKEEEAKDKNSILENEATAVAESYAFQADQSKAYADIALKNAKAVAEANKKAAEGDTSIDDSGLQGGDDIRGKTPSFGEISDQTIETDVSGDWSISEGKSIEDLFNQEGLSLADAKQAIKDQASAYYLTAQSYFDTVSVIDARIASVSAKNIATDYVAKQAGKSKDGSGSGSGKDGSKKEDEYDPQETDQKRYEDEIERYQEVNALLERQSALLENLEGKKDKYYGKKYIESSEAYAEALRTENILLEEKKRQAEEYLQQDIETLKGLGFTVETDESGFVTNAEDLMKNYVDAYNKEVEEWDDYVNSKQGEVSEEEEKAHEDRLQKIEDGKTAIDQVFESENVILETTQEIEDNLTNISEEIYDQINHGFEVQNDLYDAQIEKVEFLNKKMGESYQNAPSVFANMASTADMYIGKLKEYDEAYIKAFNAFAIGEMTEADFVEVTKEIQEGIYENSEALLDLNEELKESYIDFLGTVQEELEKVTDKYDHLIEITETYEDLLSLMGRSDDFSTLTKLYSAREDAAKSKYEASEQTYQIFKDNYEELVAQGVKDAEILYEAESKMLEAESNMLDDLQSYVEASQQVRDNAINKSTSRLEKKIFGMSSDELSEQLDYLSAKQEDWLTKTNQAYETEKMIRTATLAIENSSNEVAKKKLQTFVKETNELAKQEKLSKYQLEEQQARYEVLLAEIALQEAQNTKSQVSLQRDNEGNFNYVYTADQNKISEAEQAYADAENNLYNIRLEGANEYAQKYMETMQEMLDKMAEVYEDETLSTSEKNKRLKEIQEQYYDLLIDIESIYTIASEGLADRQNEAWTTSIMDNIASSEEFENATDTHLANCKSAYKAWDKVVKEASIEINKNLGNIKSRTSEVDAQFNTTSEQVASSLSYMTESVSSWATNVSSRIGQVINYYTALAEAIETVVNAQTGFDASTDWHQTYKQSSTISTAYQALENRDVKLAADPTYYEKYGSTWDALMGQDNNEHEAMLKATTLYDLFSQAAQREAKLQYLRNQGEAGEQYANDMTANGNTTKEILKNILMDKFNTSSFAEVLLTGTNEITAAMAQDIWNYYMSPSEKTDELKKQLQSKYIGAFDTGGYTGEFGPEGKLAILHQKELVLNEQDTKNLLDTVDIVRDLIDSIEFNSLLSSLGSISVPTFGNIGGDTLQQEVSITAEFPNVQDRNEIEEAFKNIINTASQYANRKSH